VKQPDELYDLLAYASLSVRRLSVKLSAPISICEYDFLPHPFLLYKTFNERLGQKRRTDRRTDRRNRHSHKGVSIFNKH
jgi:hypothetical protein